MRTCPVCGTENEDGAFFCAACGAGFPSQIEEHAQANAQNVEQMQGMPYQAPMQNGMLVQQGMPYQAPMQNGMPVQQGIPYQAPMQNGMPMQQAMQPKQKPPKQKPPKREKTKEQKRKAKVITALVIVLVLLLAGGAVFLYLMLDNRKITINLNDYIEVKYDGYAGYGTATATFNSKKFIDDYKEKIRFTRYIGDAYNKKYGYKIKNKEIKNMYDPYDMFCDLVLPQANESGRESGRSDMSYDETDSYSEKSTTLGNLSKKTSLDNGDTIDFTWNLSVEESILKGFNVQLEYSDLQVQVAGLEQLATMDMFSGVNVTFEGYAPNGTAKLEANTDDVYLNYTLDKTEGLKNGDTVVVTVTYDKAGEDLSMYCVDKYQKLPESETKEFVVEGLPSYAMKLDEISDDMKARMDEKARADIAKKVYDDITINSVDFLGYYMLTSKKEQLFSCNTMVYLVYRLNISDDDEMATIYYAEGFEDITILADGTETADLDEYDTAGTYYGLYGVYGCDTLDAVFKECVTDRVEDYDYESTVTE